MAKYTFDKDRVYQVRLSSRLRQAAYERAEEQGVVLAQAIRRLLELWIAGAIDLTELDRQRLDLPDKSDLDKLGARLDKLCVTLVGLAGECDEARSAIETFGLKFDAILSMPFSVSEVRKRRQRRTSRMVRGLGILARER